MDKNNGDKIVSQIHLKIQFGRKDFVQKAFLYCKMVKFGPKPSGFNISKMALKWLQNE